MLIRAPPNNIFPEGEQILNINRILRLEGLSPVKTELVQAGRCRSKNPVVISEVLLPYVPWDSPLPEEMSRRWVFDDFAHGIVRSLEEKYDVAESYSWYHTRILVHLEIPLPSICNGSLILTCHILVIIPMFDTQMVNYLSLG